MVRTSQNRMWDCGLSKTVQTGLYKGPVSGLAMRYRAVHFAINVTHLVIFKCLTCTVFCVGLIAFKTLFIFYAGLM